MEKLIVGARKLGLGLNETQIQQFVTYYRELIEWNQRINLTGVTDYEEVQVKHFMDSLTVNLAIGRTQIPALRPHPAALKVVDIGTGAGFPGVPLKIMLPDISLTLIESTGKKTLFLEHVREVLKLTGVDIITARSEDVAHLEEHRSRYDVVLARAVAALPTLLELTLPFCKIGGIIIAQKQAQAKTEIGEAARAARLLGGRLKEVVDIRVAELAGRCLIIYEKTVPTPKRYPRRPGIPLKEPLV